MMDADVLENAEVGAGDARVAGDCTWNGQRSNQFRVLRSERLPS